MAGKKKNSQDSKNAESSKSSTSTKSKGDSSASTDTKKPTRGLALTEKFSWTGKLPTALFHEHCQKNSWKITYDVQNHGPKGHFASIKMSWMNPKTSTLVYLKVAPDSEVREYKETALEAKQFCATFALHRFNYGKNLKIVLPLIFRDYWSVLEKKRLELSRIDRGRHDYFYSPDPFKYVLAQEVKAKAKTSNANETTRDLDRKSNVITKSESSNATKEDNATTDKTYTNNTLFDLSSESRTHISKSLRNRISWVSSSNLYLENDSTWTDKSLLDLNFRPQHIKEAQLYTKSTIAAIEWLLFNIPEDDLPENLQQTQNFASVKLKISNDYQKEKLISGFVDSGYEKAKVVDVTEKLLNYFQIAVSLMHDLVGYTYTYDGEITEEDELKWLQEIEDLKMAYEDKIVDADDHKLRMSLKPIDPKGKRNNKIDLVIARCENYPNNLVGLELLYNGFDVAGYIKTSVLKKLGTFIIDYIGESYMYFIVDWIEQNFYEVIDHPGPLIDPTLQIEIKRKIETNFKKAHKNFVVSKSDIKKITENYESRLNSSNFKNKINQRSNLPAWKLKDEILRCVAQNQITFITGETGSGKSTQIVQFILDELNSTHRDFNTSIICTQPRRISTIGLADRISEERCDKVGSETGYIIRGENKTSTQTRISFVTTGVLLKIIQSLKSRKHKEEFFEKFKYIVIDEVHERSIDIDFLLIILKKMVLKFPVKIILMSATINLATFESFFNSKLNHLHISGRTFPIENHYLDTVLQKTQFKIKNHSNEWVVLKANSNFFLNGNINYDLIAELVIKINSDLNIDGKRGSMLIFLTGVYEITQCIDAINNKSDDFWVLPLHSALSSAAQKKIFSDPPRGKRKIVVSTNIAETSITIPDCIVVIDSGRGKKMMFDSNLNTSKLIEDWCSKAEVNQRRGRSGRVTNGTCYKLYTKETEYEMLEQPIPEIKRTRLENIYLIIKSMGESSVSEFLAAGLDVPDSSLLNQSRNFLVNIGAVSATDDSITSLGTYLSMLPTDLQSGKLLVFGCIFNCIENCLTLASIGTTGSPFLNSADKIELKRIKLKFSKGQGDMLSIVNAYGEFASLKGGFQKWCRENCLSYNVLQEIRSARLQYLNNLKEIGFVPLHYKVDSLLNKNNSNSHILKAIITGAFYPQIAQVQYPDPKFLNSGVGAVQVDSDSRQNKFWIRNDKYTNSGTGSGSANTSTSETKIYPKSRAFIHPSSILFGNASELEDIERKNQTDSTKGLMNDTDAEDTNKREDGLAHFSDLILRNKPELKPTAKISKVLLKAPFITYNTSQYTQKLYLRDVTPTNALSILLFGGSISYNLESLLKGGRSCVIIIDDWLHIKTWCKNAVLIKQLKVLLDEFIQDKLAVPCYDDVSDAESNNDNGILQILETIFALDEA